MFTYYVVAATFSVKGLNDRIKYLILYKDDENQLHARADTSENLEAATLFNSEGIANAILEQYAPYIGKIDKFYFHVDKYITLNEPSPHRIWPRVGPIQ